MNDSGITQQSLEDNVTGRFRGGMLRAVFSAAVFGAIGAYLGKWLGKRGNAENSNMAEPIMTWSMGAFWAVLAAYSSLKASDPVTQLPQPSAPEREKGSTIRDFSTVRENVSEQANAVPAAQVHKAMAATQGLVQENTSLMVTQK